VAQGDGCRAVSRVSVIIPVYNVEKYLPDCLDSLLAQTMPDWEAILVDDGSTDASGRICDRYSAQDARFKVIHQQNGGAASAKNAGLDAAEGEFVGFMDSDDHVAPNWLEACLHAMRAHDAGIVEYDLCKEYRTHSESENHYPDPYTCFSAEEYLAQYLHNWTCSLFWNKLFRAELVRDVRFRRERRCIDDEFFTYKAIGKAERIVRIADVLYHYRQRASSAVGNQKNRLQITRDALDVLVERYEWICARFPVLRRIYLCHDVEILFYIKGFAHDAKTVSAFRKAARYYLFQALRHGVDRITMINVIQLQFVSSATLMQEKAQQDKQTDMSQYFE